MSRAPAAEPAGALILASGSRFRAQLLERLGIPFEATAPGIDETPGAGEPAPQLAQRLALEKARSVAAKHPGRWVVGSDQVATCDNRILGKPGTRAGAIRQLELLSGRSAVFYTAVTLLNDAREAGALDTTIVRFRALAGAEIERYVDREPAFDCAGSFQSEGLGISLCASIETRDPTALIGLPLIALRGLLAEAGYPVP